MNARFCGLVIVALAISVTPSRAQTLVESDFAKGDFNALGWQVKGDWDVYRVPAEVPNPPGTVARFAANKPDGSLSKSFAEVTGDKTLSLALDYGWGWGTADQGSDAVSFMLVDAKDDGYYFEIHRCKANWAVQWATVARGVVAKEHHWAPVEIDASYKAVRDGGGLARLSVTRAPGGQWKIGSANWNKGAGAAVEFSDSTTTTLSKVVLLGTQNFDEQIFNKVVVTSATKEAVATTAIPVGDFLDSIGIVTSFPDRGQPLPKTVEMVKYAGFRWVRGGIEGVTEDGPTTIQTYIDLHKQTGAKFSWGLVSGGVDIARLMATAKQLAAADALLAFEGNNEPNNWGVTYLGEKGGGPAPSWMAVAKLQRDVYNAVKTDPALRKYPVWSISENGAETDNVGLQFLKIPEGAETLLPAGTTFADFANVHNYVYHPGSPGLLDNKTWNAADPTSACKVDGLYGNYGRTWAKHFQGYTEKELLTLPRVTTETGTTIGGEITEEIQAQNIVSMYLDQFKRGWKHTAVYLLRDRGDEAGNQSFGLFRADYSPRKAAVYLHNLTTILADRGAASTPTTLSYVIPIQPATVHDMLLQKSDGTFALVVWSERLKGSDEVTVRLGKAYADVKIYDPSAGTEPVRTLKAADAITLTMSDRPFVIEISEK